ncbi:hypothetical protein [Bradyrhizobium japonicum]|uniref:hypothetical protein n=1 Tax=Bradyrhizobium japonicum TaxID=375 RepID=UPI0020130F51|nr:hypothetical protein [Bradyrhizobium japonicum]
MSRRECVALPGTIAVLPVSVMAQQPRAVRRLGVLSVIASDDEIDQARLVDALAGLG